MKDKGVALVVKHLREEAASLRDIHNKPDVCSEIPIPPLNEPELDTIRRTTILVEAEACKIENEQ